MSKKDIYDLAVIGAGAAGIFAAITAARRGCCVVLIEHSNQIGKKLLSTGNGRCNFSNLLMQPDCYHSSSGEGYFRVIEDYDSDCLQAFFQELGMLITNKNGYLYPATQSAVTVLEIFKLELERLQVKIKTNTILSQLTQSNDQFQLMTDSGYIMHAKNVLLATGSKAAPFTGSDGSGYDYAVKFGHRLVPIVPSLTGIESSDSFFHHIPKIRFDGTICVMIENKQIYEEKGQLQLSDYGISGIPVFQLSRYVSYAAQQKKHIKGTISFVEENYAQILKKLHLIAKVRANNPIRKLLIGIVDGKLIAPIIKRLDIDSSLLIQDMTEADFQKVASFLTGFEFRIQKTRGYNDAQVCAGGIDLNQIDLKTMESKIVKGLYFAGEILDVDGKCGGYNLQWAFSSAHKAAMNIRDKGDNG
ncbi:aminoacetone oxidase family FAD-binding enzyme [Eubacterium oxidoreducens]|uniref:Flavoprotein, HI0933 family n=1 Tax=Eubacterium oxidoreducens TaxID=1732 RepID=A0A1G6AL98_EUBOX|nr:aminoacetone oxidase family FAD-binding enzyme [Eubacterium oxidoreducens]SDB09164.1 hypothetical protein SAMN02910417_00666 [Eubacterium oxidoreducens]